MKITRIGKETKGRRQCVISLGIGKDTYTACLRRLEESLRRVRFDGDFIYWNEIYPENSPEHFSAPFGFKPYCFFAARQLGYDQILWIDSPCIAIRSLEPVFKDMESHGYILFNNNYGQTMGQWSSDEALAKNGLTREQALRIPEIPCSVLGLDLRSSIAQQFLHDWNCIMSDGVTAKGTRDTITDWEDYQAIAWNRNSRVSSDRRVRGHRHDQTAAGIVAHRLGMSPYADYLRDIHYEAKPIDFSTSILHHREFGDRIATLDEIYYSIFFYKPFLRGPLSLVRKVAGKMRSIMSRYSGF
ncbi:hypothetical protein NZK33_00250 [Cyanobium sp. FGCU-6]|nr:hypothetical protein [Cyanobium sp. FGCU6]